jgi:hypothetical protein
MPSASLELVIPAARYRATTLPITAQVNIGGINIIGAYFQFPSGCQYAAEVQVVATSGQINELVVPTVDNGDALDYIAFDSASGLYIPIGYEMEGSGTLICNGWNEDPANQHWIKILFLLELLNRRP